MMKKESLADAHIYRAYKTLILSDALLADLDMLEIESNSLKITAFKPIYSREVKRHGKLFRDLLIERLRPLIKPASDQIDALAVADQISSGGNLIDRLLKINLQVSNLNEQYQTSFDIDLGLLCDRYGITI